MDQRHPAGPRRTSRVAIVLVVALVGGCSGGSERGAPNFVLDQLPTLVAQPADAPPGTHYDQTQSGPAPVDLLSQGVAAAAQKFDSLGFRGGYTSIFVSTSAQLPGGALIGSGVFEFADAAAAHQALEVHKTVVVPAELQGYKEITVSGLGEEAYGFTFTLGPSGGPGAIYVFRIRNAVFVVPGKGLDRDALLRLARTVARRAQ